LLSNSLKTPKIQVRHESQIVS